MMAINRRDCWRTDFKRRQACNRLTLSSSISGEGAATVGRSEFTEGSFEFQVSSFKSPLMGEAFGVRRQASASERDAAFNGSFEFGRRFGVIVRTSHFESGV